MIKITLVVIFIAIYGIISLPLYLVVDLIGKKNPRKKVEISQKFVSGGFRFILRMVGIKLEVDGVENIPKDEGIMYIANHRSYFDIVVTYATLPTLTGFISKDDMKKFPVISNWMKRLNCLFLDRDDVRQGLKVILEAIENVKNGYSVFVMPEGTRNKTDELLPFKDATFKIAQKTGCAVVPVAIVGADDHFEKHFPKVTGGTIRLRYGKPVYMEDIPKEDKKHPGELFRGIIKDMLDDMGN